MTTPASELPQFNGRPVPWIARWSGEIIRDPYSLIRTTNGPRYSYPDGNDFHDDHGVLWQREGVSRNGEPLYADVNTYRQRTAMRKCRCQVCGVKIAERPIRWLLPSERELGVFQLDDDTVTMSAPTCTECIQLALDVCPNLKSQGHQIYRVLDYEIWGVFAETQVNGFGRMMAPVAYHDTEYSMSLLFAKQQIVKFTKFVPE